MAAPTNQTHAVVNFTQEKSVAVVPKAWINKKGNKCSWPESGNAKKLAKKSKPQSKDWPLYDCKILHWFDSYAEAAAKLNDATYTSDLSDTDKLKTKAPKLVAVTLPVAPTTSQGAHSSQALPMAAGSTQPSPSSSLSSASSLPAYQSASPTSIPVNNNTSIAAVNCDDGNDSFSLDEVNYTLTDGNPIQLACSLECQDFRKDVLLKLETIEQKLDSQSELTILILNRLSDLLTEKTLDSSFSFPPGHFPLKDTSAVDELYALVTRNSAAFNKLVSVLKISGGGTVDEAVKLMLKSVMTDEVLSKYCFKGQSGKKTFCSHDAILNAMLDALTHNILTKGSATKDSLGKSIPKALKQAADRMSQRRKNAPRSTAASTNVG